MPLAPLIFTGTSPGCWPGLAGLIKRCDGMPVADAEFALWLDLVFDDSSATDAAAAALRQFARKSGLLPTGLDSRAAQALDRIERDLPQSRFVLFVESPLDTMAQALRARPDLPSSDVLSHWRDSASRILRFVQRRGARCLVVSVNDLASGFDQFIERVNAWLGEQCLGVEPTWSEQFQASRPSALCRLLAERLVPLDAPTLQLFQQLHACSVPLDPDANDAFVPVDGVVDSAAAWHEYSALLARCRHCKAELEDAERKARELGDAIDALQQNELNAATAAAHESGLLLLQIEVGQRALDQTTALCSELQSKLEQLRLERDALAAALEESSAALTNSKQAAALNAASDREQLEKSLRQARDESDLLLIQQYRAQEDLERLHFENRRLRSGLVTDAAGSSNVQIGSVVLGRCQNLPPHCSLDFELSDVRFGSRQLANLQVRLVEHHGRPGLVLFRPNGQPSPPLSGWRDSGVEGDRSFMLIVPSDKISRQALSSLPSADWDLLRALPGKLDETILESSSALAPWRDVARRLHLQFGEMPDRLRYDRIDLRAMAGGSSTCLNVLFRAAQFGQRRFEALALAWYPAQGNQLHVLKIADSSPLTCWPREASGTPANEWRVPVGRGMTGREKRRAWAAVEAGDRALLLGILDALPAVPGRMGEQKLTVPINAEDCARAARSMLPDALGHSRGLVLRVGQRLLSLLDR